MYPGKRTSLGKVCRGYVGGVRAGRNDARCDPDREGIVIFVRCQGSGLVGHASVPAKTVSPGSSSFLFL